MMVTIDLLLAAQLGEDVQAAHAGQLEIQKQQVVLRTLLQALEELPRRWRNVWSV